MLLQFLVELMDNNQPELEKLELWLNCALGYEEFASPSNAEEYIDYLFRYVIPMTRRDLINRYLKDRKDNDDYKIPYEYMLNRLSPSDHAFALVSMVNHHSDWTGKLDDHKQKNKENIRKVKSRWTRPSNRNKYETGWDLTGLALYNKCTKFFEGFMESGGYWEEMVRMVEDVMDEKKKTKEVRKGSLRRKRQREIAEASKKIFDGKAHVFNPFKRSKFQQKLTSSMPYIEPQGEENENSDEGGDGSL